MGPGIDMDIYSIHKPNYDPFMQNTLYNDMQ